MLKTLKDVGMTIGRSIKEALNNNISYVKNLFAKPAIEGEYIAKGAVNHSRRAFFSKSALATAAVACLVMLPAVSFAAVDVSVTTAITDAAADVATIGAAVLTVIVGIYAFKWLRRAF